jgi:hypothetical protein
MTAARENSKRRRRPSRQPRTRLLIVCGATRTEPTYLSGLRQAARNPAVAVKVATHPRDPKSVVNYARKLRDQAPEDFDQIWCVLDVDEFEFEIALSTARQEQIALAISNPCFEFWLLLHHLDMTAPLSSPGAALRHLKGSVPGYGKTDLRFNDFAKWVPDAVRRAKALPGSNEILGPNPSTGMWRLAELMTEADQRSVPDRNHKTRRRTS